MGNQLHDDIADKLQIIHPPVGELARFPESLNQTHEPMYFRKRQWREQG
jgi:hypothetical protein